MKPPNFYCLPWRLTYQSLFPLFLFSFPNEKHFMHSLSAKRYYIGFNWIVTKGKRFRPILYTSESSTGLARYHLTEVAFIATHLLPNLTFKFEPETSFTGLFFLYPIDGNSSLQPYYGTRWRVTYDPRKRATACSWKRKFLFRTTRRNE